MILNIIGIKKLILGINQMVKCIYYIYIVYIMNGDY